LGLRPEPGAPWLRNGFTIKPVRDLMCWFVPNAVDGRTECAAMRLLGTHDHAPPANRQCRSGEVEGRRRRLQSDRSGQQDASRGPYLPSISELLRRLPRLSPPHLRSGMRLVDFGCGAGSLSCGFARLIAPGGILGIDMSDDAIGRARALVDQSLRQLRSRLRRTAQRRHGCAIPAVVRLHQQSLAARAGPWRSEQRPEGSRSVVGFASA